MTAIKSRYRCPRCNSYNSANVDKIFDGRLLFSCSKCNICALVPKDADTDASDSAYLEFLDLYDNGPGGRHMGSVLSKIITRSDDVQLNSVTQTGNLKRDLKAD